MDTTTVRGHSSADCPEGTAQLLYVGPRILNRAWPDVLHFLKQAPLWWTARYDPDDVAEELMIGRFHLWMANDDEKFLGIAIMEMRQYPKMKICNFALLVGTEMPRWLPQLETVELWAKSCGAQFMVGTGRKGWGRVLAQNGYQEESRVFAKNLETMTIN